jgi:protein-tyrosine-phosphatase
LRATPTSNFAAALSFLKTRAFHKTVTIVAVTSSSQRRRAAAPIGWPARSGFSPAARGRNRHSLANIDTMPMSRPLNVLFLCTHNSARSILAEAMLNHLGEGRFRAYSAGSSPRPNQQPNPLALRALEAEGISTAGLHSKSWDVFAAPDAPRMDLIITVCDNAAGEVCPVWPGHPASAHWGYPDPSNVEGSEDERLQAFRATLAAIGRRLERLVAQPPEALRPESLAATARALAQEERP